MRTWILTILFLVTVATGARGEQAQLVTDSVSQNTQEVPSVEAEKRVKQEPKNVFTLDANLMTRGEIRRGGLPGAKEGRDENMANFAVERTRLILGYQRDFLQIKVNIQHQGLWGSENSGNFNIYEAWAQLQSKNGFFMRIGRQEMVYDDERILGNNDWAMAALSHDGLKVGYEGHGHKIHAFAAYNQNSKNVNGGTYYRDGAQPYKSMQMLWYHYDVPKFPLGISLTFMNIGMQNGYEDNYFTTNQQVWGTYVTYKPKKLKLEAAYYRQSGKTSLNFNEGSELPLKSWMLGLKATYDFNSTFSAFAGYDYLSGDNEFVVPDPGSIGMIRHTEERAFKSVFGENHKFYGAMDFFFVSTYYDTNSPGLQNLFGGVVVKPVKNLTLQTIYHYMAITSDVKGLKKPLGHQIELDVKYSIAKDITLAAGYSFMRGTETMQRLRRSTEKRQLHWAWLMLTISPRIFSAIW